MPRGAEFLISPVFKCAVEKQLQLHWKLHPDHFWSQNEINGGQEVPCPSQSPSIIHLWISRLTEPLEPVFDYTKPSLLSLLPHLTVLEGRS